MLILVRHGESLWNLKNIFTGWVDVGLSCKGVEEAYCAGEKLKDVPIDVIFTSKLLRAERTAELIYEKNCMASKRVLYREGQGEFLNMLPLKRTETLNERHYGDLQGLDKDVAREKYGKEKVHIWRRSYDTPPPKGESLKDTCNRVLPYFKSDIEPCAKNKVVLVAAHGNSLRALIKELEGISDSDIVNYEINTAEIKSYIYKGNRWELI